MKFIHCSDIHLDSPMSSIQNPRKAEGRRNEILLTFVRMVRYAAKNQVRAILITGDLFDGERISLSTLDIVKDCITGNPGIDFLYIGGNHDHDAFIKALPEIPENLKLFPTPDTEYHYEGNVVVTSAEDPKALDLRAHSINIVMHHGAIRVEQWRGKCIDYLALGHYHELKEGSLGNRGRYCYPGCLEGRGFDEAGEKGFVRLDIEGGTITPVFVQAAKRLIHNISVDMTGVMETGEMDRRIDKALTTQDIPSDDLVKIELFGNADPRMELKTSYLEKKYGDKYFAFKIDTKKLRSHSDEDSYDYDKSLRGEFVRLVMASDFSEDDRNRIIRLGVAALEGRKEEI